MNTTQTMAETLADCYAMKPKDLIISELKWRYLVRSILKGKNILLLGDSGCGKTKAAIAAAGALARRFAKFNCGAMQDPRSSLIGNTQFDKDKGTFFAESEFISTIRTPKSVCFLDEISRCHPDGWNILMTALDELQRYVRLDEKTDREVVSVAEGVCFIATANVGNEYTATRVIDRALLDRFSVIIEMDSLNKEDEFDLLKQRHPSVSEAMLEALAEITTHTRELSSKEGEKLTNYISTRSAIEIAELLSDGFTLREAAEAAIYPLFSKDSGVESERTYVMQYVQKFIPAEPVKTAVAGAKKKNNLPF